MNDITDRRSFGEYIRKKRLEGGLTQKELAGRLYVTESTVSKWERGLSYPDISMVAPICATLNISEHEFFTACDDESARIQARQANLWQRITKVARLFCAVSYSVALVTCFICNLVIFHTLDWFWIVLTALMMAFSFTNLPALVGKNKLSICLGAATGSLILLMLACWLYTGNWWVLGGAVITAVCLTLPWSWWAIWRFYGKHVSFLCMAAFSVWVFLLLTAIRAFTGGEWLLSFGYPLAVFGVGYVWLYFAVISWLPVGIWLKIAFCALLSTFAVPLGNTLSAALLPHQHTPALMDYFSWGCFLSREDVNGTSWINVLVFAILLAVSLVLLAFGIAMEIRRKKE